MGLLTFLFFMSPYMGSSCQIEVLQLRFAILFAGLVLRIYTSVYGPIIGIIIQIDWVSKPKPFKSLNTTQKFGVSSMFFFMFC